MPPEFFEAVAQVFKIYRESLADGKLTMHEVMTLMCNGASTFTRLIEQLNPADGQGAQKKEVALEVIGQFYDTVLAPIDITGIPNFLEPMVDSAVRSLLLSIGSAAIDSSVALFNRLGWGDGTLRLLDSTSVSALPPGFTVIGV